MKESSRKPGMKDKPSQIGCFKSADETTYLASYIKVGPIIRNAEYVW